MNNLTVLVPKIDAVKPKNMYQYSGLTASGCKFVVLTSDSTGRSTVEASVDPNVEVHVCSRTRPRSWYLTTVLRMAFSRHIDIAEVYPDSLLMLLLCVILKAARIPIVIVARGEEWWYVTGRMSRMRRLAFRLTYKLADHVIFKELYMRQMLEQFGKSRITLLPNSVPIPDRVYSPHSDRCHLLFMNTLKAFRHPEIPVEAFLDLCQELGLDRSSNVRLQIVGFQDENGLDAEYVAKQRKIRDLIGDRNVPIDLEPWTNQPAQWLDQADVFLLPADVVFLNYSLLEAMARGIAPIIQAAEGSELIVNHGVSGYVLEPDAEAWKTHMRKVILDAALRTELGKAARRQVQETYSFDAYLTKYRGVYQGILGVPADQVSDLTCA